MNSRVFALAVLGLSVPALGQSTPGYIVRTYATVKDSVGHAWAPDGALYLGRDNSGSGGGFGDPVKVWRVGPGGSPVEEYGKAGKADPDAVGFDAVGKVTGAAGSVVMGGVTAGSTTTGTIFVVEPDQDVRTLFGPSKNYYNPAGFAFDADGTMFVSDVGDAMADDVGHVVRSDGAEPTVIATLTPPPGAIALHPDGRIFITRRDGRITVLAASGSVLVETLADGFAVATNIALAPAGEPWGGLLYALESDGSLWKVSPSDGSKTELGSTGADRDVSFGPDGAMYLGDFAADKVLRMVPCRVNCNGDGSLNVNDFICFQSKWRTKDAYGDYDKSGTYTVNDFIRYQADFVKGCP